MLMRENKNYFSSFIRQNVLCLITVFATTVGMWIMFLSVVCFINRPIDPINEPINEPIITSEPIEVIEIIEYETSHEVIPVEIDIYTTAQNEYFIKMLELGCGEISKEEWYLGYKQLICEYEEYLDLPATVYDYFTEEDIYLIQRAVETEVYQASFDAKVNVASVIFNRINDGRFGKSVKEVITNPGQFAWHRKKISDSTVLAVEYAFEIGDTTDGCLAFRSDKKPQKWGKWVYSFSDNAVHHFYKEGYKQDNEEDN